MGFPDRIERTVAVTQLPEDARRKAYDGNTDSWGSELVDYLDAA